MSRLVLRAYPPSFRARYGDELAALVDDMGPKATAGNLLLGAAQAWLRPRFSGADGPRRRVQASLATTWAAWCAGFLVAPAINRALLDPPGAGVTRGVRSLLDAAEVLFFCGWALALLGAAPVVLRAVVPALGAGERTALRPLVPALVLGVLEAIGLIPLALTHGSLVVGVLWLIGFAAFVASLGVGPAAALTRLAPAAAALRVPAALTLPVAVVLAGLTGCSLAAVILAGGAALVGSALPVIAVLAVGCVASLVAVTSSARGLAVARG